MRDTVPNSAAKYLKQEIVTSRDRQLQSEEFRRLFSCEDAADLHGLDDKAQEMWATLVTLVKILRKRPGKSLAELRESTGLLESQLQFNIRTLIDIGGEIELVTDGELKEGRFFLHN